MTEFYIVNDFANNTITFVTQDQQTYDFLNANISNVIVGTMDDANDILSSSKTYFINNIMEHNINKSIVTPDDVYIWIRINNIDDEPDNDDVVYNLLNVPNGDIISTIGTSNAKSIQSNIESQMTAYSYGKSSVVKILDTEQCYFANGKLILKNI